MKFQPGQVVHVIRPQKCVMSGIISKAFTYLGGIRSEYKIQGHDGIFQERHLFATHDNAMAELNRQNEEGK